MRRQIFQQTVNRARNTARISIASPGDFVCDPAELFRGPPRIMFPYCFDFLRRRTIYVAGLEAEKVQSAPFYYLHLRRAAQELFSVPIEYGPLSQTPSEQDPVFLFSPGRCGSTLMSRVLHEAGIASVSEPDFYTQMASAFWSSRLNMLRGAFETAMWSMSDDLSAALGGVPVVKLRAECARAPELFVRGRSAKTIVLFRSFDSWARSTARTFGAGPQKSVRKYLTALRCYAALQSHSRCHLMRYEDWETDPAAASAALGRFLGVDIPAEAVVKALSGHSQRGTPLESRILPGWEAKWLAAVELWQSPRLVTARARLDIPNVWD